jgi:cell division control protein 6
MDENAFRREINRKSVFKKVGSLDLSYVPEKLVCRDDVLKTLIIDFRRILEEPEPPSINCLIMGKAGVGKTVTSRYFGKNFSKVALEKDVKIFIEYFNCINFRSKSKIVRELLGKYQHGSGRGYSDDEALKLILTKLNRGNEYMLLIIDEVHLLKHDEVLAFLDIAETYGHQNAKLSVLLISRIQDWMRIETERILSRLNEKIKLRPYNFEESMQILKHRSGIAFKENIIDDDILTMIAQIVVENKNMRHGIEILRKSGLYADREGLDRVTPDTIREAANEVYPAFRGDIVDQLKIQELLALYGVVRALINKKLPFTFVEDAYHEYHAICENYSIESHVKMSFRKYIRHLAHLKVIASRTIRKSEVQRGRHLEITLLDIPAVKLEELLKDILERKYNV